jgi:hypothetical protein
MRVGDALLALAVAAAGFVVVAAVVTEVASAAVEFSLFVGLPAGALAGLLAGPSRSCCSGPEIRGAGAPAGRSRRLPSPSSAASSR